MYAKKMFPGALALKQTPEKKYPVCEWQSHDLNGWSGRQLFFK
jgi:hypothetical protein